MPQEGRVLLAVGFLVPQWPGKHLPSSMGNPSCACSWGIILLWPPGASVPARPCQGQGLGPRGSPVGQGADEATEWLSAKWSSFKTVPLSHCPPDTGPGSHTCLSSHTCPSSVTDECGGDWSPTARLRLGLNGVPQKAGQA